MASRGTSLKHSLHFFVVGSAGSSFLERERDISMFMGLTTKKNTEPATSRNETRAFKKCPYLNSLPLIVKMSPLKSGTLAIAAIRGVSKSDTKAVTIVPNAAPITTPTAKSTTLPRSKNCLNSLSINSNFAKLCRVLLILRNHVAYVLLTRPNATFINNMNYNIKGILCYNKCMLTIELILLGLFIGGITGITGASGVLILVPILSTFFNLSLPVILGISLSVDIIASIGVSYTYFRSHNLDIKGVSWLIVGALLGAQIGSFFVVSISKIFIMAVLATGMIYFGIKMWQSGFSNDKKFSITLYGNLSNFIKTQIGMILCGLIIGLTTGIFGAGGGLTIFIILYSFLNFPLKKAIGTSSFVMLLTAFSGVVGYWAGGNLNIAMGLILGISAAIGGTMSSILANKMEEKTLARLIGIFFIFLAIVMITLKVVFPLIGMEF